MHSTKLAIFLVVAFAAPLSVSAGCNANQTVVCNGHGVCNYDIGSCICYFTPFTADGTNDANAYSSCNYSMSMLYPQADRAAGVTCALEELSLVVLCVTELVLIIRKKRFKSNLQCNAIIINLVSRFTKLINFLVMLATDSPVMSPWGAPLLIYRLTDGIALMSYWLLALFLQRMNYGRIAQIALRKGQRKQIAFMLCFEIAFLVFACFSVQINKNVVIFDQIYIAMICIPAVLLSFVIACLALRLNTALIIAAQQLKPKPGARPATIQVVSQGGGAKQPQSRSAPAAPNAAVVQAPVPSPAQPTSRKLSQTADRALTPNSEPRQLALPGQVLAEREHRESASQPMQPLLAENRNTSTDASASLMAAGTPKSAPAQSPAVAANAQVNAAVKSPTQSPQQQTGALAINVNVNANTNVRKSVASAPPPAVSSVPAQEPRRIAGMRVLVWLGLNSALFGIVTTAIVVWGLTPIPAGKLVANFITLRVLSWWWMFTTMLMYWPKKDDDE